MKCTRYYKGHARGGEKIGKYFVFHGRQDGKAGMHKVLYKNTKPWKK